MNISLTNWLNTNVYTKTNEAGHQRLRNASRDYINGLVKWQKFILFHHTLRSAHINRLLKAGIYDGYERGLGWAREFLSHIEENRLQNNPNAYPIYHLENLYISNIIRDRNPGNIELQYDMVRYMMYQYITQLQTILLNAPLLENDIYVYKVTRGMYPGLPATATWRMTNPIPVKQNHSMLRPCRECLILVSFTIKPASVVIILFTFPKGIVFFTYPNSFTDFRIRTKYYYHLGVVLMYFIERPLLKSMRYPREWIYKNDPSRWALSQL